MSFSRLPRESIGDNAKASPLVDAKRQFDLRAAKPPLMGGKAAVNLRRILRRNTQPHFPALLRNAVCATRKWQKCGDNR